MVVFGEKLFGNWTERLNLRVSHIGVAADVASAISSTGQVAGVVALATNPIGLAVIASVAVAGTGVLAARALWTWRKNRDGNSAKPDIPRDSVPDGILRTFDALSNDRNSSASDALENVLIDLMDDPDWANVERRLDEAVRDWDRERSKRTADPPTHAEMVRVLSNLIRNLREAAYRELFANHHRLEVSVGRSRVDDVFVRLLVESRPEAPAEPDESQAAQLTEESRAPEYLDFRGDTPTDIGDTLRQSGNRNLVILGEPGSGKSSLLRHLAASCAQSDGAGALLPVFLPLRDYATGQENLIADHAVKFAKGELQTHLPDRFFENALDNGRCLVCLDALDEVPAEKRRSIVGSVEQLTRRYPNSRFIVTSRLAGYGGDLGNRESFNEQIFARCVVQPMDDDHIDVFIDRLCPDDPERAQSLRGVLAANPSIKSLASNPLLMTMLNLVHRKGATGLPLNRAEFYKEAVAFLVQDKDDAGEKIDQHGHRRLKNLLTAIACSLHNGNRETIVRDALEDLVVDVLLKSQGTAESPTRDQEDEAFEEAEAFIERAERRTGLLVERRTGSGDFGFVHATFREYLTAEDIHARHRHYRRHREECWEEIKSHLTEARWREVILMLLGSLDERYCTYLTEKILAAGGERYGLTTHLRLAADALANQAPMSRELQREIVGRLETVGKWPGGSVSPRNAIKALYAIRHLPEMVIPALIAIATNPAVGAQEVRGRCMSVVVGLEPFGEIAIPALTDIATDPAVDTWNRVYTAGILGRLGEEEKAIPLLTAIANAPAVDALDRLYAVRVLERLGESETAIPALTAIATDPAVHTLHRTSAVQELARLNESAIPALTAIATDPAVDTEHRVSAMEGLERLGESAIPALTAIATNPSVDARCRLPAVERLERLGERETVIQVLTAIATDPAVDARHRESAAGGLGRIGERETAIQVLTAIATDPAVDARCRESAARRLERLGERETAIQALTAVATDPVVEPAVRRSAAESLFLLGERNGAIQALAAIAIDPAVDVLERVYAARKLSFFGPSRSGLAGITLLTRLAKNPAHRELLRSSAVDTLTLMARLSLSDIDGEREAAKAALGQLAQDVEVAALVRGRAGWQLGQLGESHAAIAALTGVVNDPTAPAMIKVRAAGAIQKLGGSTEAPVAAMRAGITDHEIGIGDRISMAWRLSDLGERDTGITTLAAIANDETVDDVNRVRASWYLGELDASELARPALNALATVAEYENADTYHRFQAGKVLADLGATETAIAVLANIAYNVTADAEDRINAATVLGDLGEKETAQTAMRSIIEDQSLAHAGRESLRRALADLTRRAENRKIAHTDYIY